jgi:3-methyl-2-oxobutanoate hydroxymethyltransferase
MSDKITVTSIKEKKAKGEKITMLTAYDYPTAKILDEAGVDIVLVGDSLGMVALGYEDTLKVTMEDMLHHTKAVKRGVKNALLVADMPFMSCHLGIEKAVYNAGRLVQEGGAQAVKIEGGRKMVEVIKAIIDTGIPVMGHIGLTPQYVNHYGGYVVQGKTKESSRELLEDVKALRDAGVFSIVVECIPFEITQQLVETLAVPNQSTGIKPEIYYPLAYENQAVPLIGIGAGDFCDGQVLVLNDMLGVYEELDQKFVKRYANLGETMKIAVSSYINEVKNSKFPSEEHTYYLNKVK